MTYGIHILGGLSDLVNKYVSGYDILYVQAAYNYDIKWFNAENIDEIIYFHIQRILFDLITKNNRNYII